MKRKLQVQPSLETVKPLLSSFAEIPNPPNLVPLCTSVPADILTPSLAYLKVSARSGSKLAFLFESCATTENIGRYSFVGANPRKVLKTGPGHGPETDPLSLLEDEISQYRVASIPGLDLPPLIGGAIGYVGYDCVKYFEPRTARPMKDILKVPESLFMLFDTIVAFDQFYQVVKVITYLKVPQHVAADDSGDAVAAAYDEAERKLLEMVDVISGPDIPLPHQGPIVRDHDYTSNIGRPGYEKHVVRLKEHIVKGDIIQAVPSQRLARPTSLHPFNVYRQLRMVNPSPYLFYIDCDEFQLVGASPELLVKSEADGRTVITHPIAGTVRRGKDAAGDERLADELRSSLKDRAEHVMLVDLARNDINRVCDPHTTNVDRLMAVEKFSHVQHLVSQVSGVLRDGMTRFDAFRSIFPAGTVSGAPKVRAMELIAEFEGEKRGIYAGAVGYFGFDSISIVEEDNVGGVEASANETDGVHVDGHPRTRIKRQEGAMDTCIALRTMVVKDGVVYLQAGGGIVFDSDPYDEYLETMNKMGANIQCIRAAEERYRHVKNDGDGDGDGDDQD